MSETFDPYTEWLGIGNRARPLSHYQLLGIPDFEKNALAIAVAADAATARLKACSPGTRAGRWQQLLDEVTLARLCLLNDTRKRQYDEQLRKRLKSAETVDSYSNSAETLPLPASDAEPAARTEAPLASANADLLPPGFLRKPKSLDLPDDICTNSDADVLLPEPMPAFREATTVPVAIAAGVVPTLGQEVPKAIPLAAPAFSADVQTSLQFIPVEDPLSTAELRKSEKSWSPSLPFILAAGLLATGGVLLAIFWQSKHQPSLSPAPASSEVASPLPAATDTTPVSPAVASPAPETVAPSESSVATSAPEDESSLPQVASPDSANGTVSAPAPLPQISLPVLQQPTEPAPPAPTPQETAAFEQSFRNTLTALRMRKLQQASQMLEETRKLLRSEEYELRFERLEHLHGYVDGFWKAVRNAFRSLQATDTLPVGNTEVAIVEIDGDLITIRDAGRNKTYTFNELPATLVTALAAQWFDASKPANKLYVGAFYAIDSQGDLPMARQLWQEASSAGASAEGVMPLLDDPAFTATLRQTR